MFNPDQSLIVIHLFPRLVGAVYFLALIPFLFEICALIGKDGIIPAEYYLQLIEKKFKKSRFYWLPTIFWVNCSDFALIGTVIVGLVLSIFLAMGYYPCLILFILMIILLSIISVGQDFLRFAWDVLLLECVYNAFLLTLTYNPNIIVWMNLNLLIFRFHLQAGVSKVQSRDSSWRDLSAMSYHYQTQPIPNSISWYLHKLPAWYHKFSTFMALFIEIVIPFGVFGNDLIRLITFLFLLILQINIGISGNYAYFTVLTMVLITPLIGDVYLTPFFETPTIPTETLWPWEALAYAGGLFLVGVQLIRIVYQFYPSEQIAKILGILSPYHLANNYGVFSHMTKTRYEIVIEGSEDQQEWKEYQFYYKPSELTQALRQVSPYHPRLDWQMWFLPFRDFKQAYWFQNFLSRLLENNQVVLSLIKKNPFPDNPPKFIRAKMYIYTFSDYEAKKISGYYWFRKMHRMYSPVLSKKAPTK